VKPELTYDSTGALTVKTVCRGRKKALKSLIQDFRDSYSHDTSLPVGIISADSQKDANWLEAQIRKEKGCEGLTIIHSQVGPVIGAHVGPGMVAIVFWGTDRREKLSLSDRIANRVRKSN
ncbi:MAG: DegV family protein, partial [Atopobium sp.]|nr:DegV family protein [Atopobium sp.]